MVALLPFLLVAVVFGWKTHLDIFGPSQTPIWNTMKTASLRPEVWEFPTTAAEIQTIVNNARTAGKRIRVIGSGHSWTPVASSNHIIVSLDQMGNGSFVYASINGEDTYTVSAGIRSIYLLEELWSRGYTVPQLGWSKAFAFGGMMGTGTHGSHKDYGIVADIVRSFKMVKADGTIITCSRTQNPDVFWNKVAMGTLGIIYEITIAVVPRFNLVLTNAFLDQADWNGTMMLPHVLEGEYTEWWWFPGNTGLQYWQQIDRVVVPFGDPIPAGVADGCLVLDGYNGPVTNGGCFDASYVAMTEEEPYHYWEMESYLPWELCGDAINEINAWIDLNDATYTNGADKTRRRNNQWYGARFVKGDWNWLSPAYGRDTCVISFGFYKYCLYEDCGEPAPYDVYTNTDEIFFDDWTWFEARARYIHKILKNKYDGRPHWGKHHWYNYEDLRSVYPRFDEFQALRKELDPQGLFMNSWTEALLDFPNSGLTTTSSLLLVAIMLLANFF